MTEEVSLTIKGVQSFGEDRDSQETRADARYFKKGESHYLFFEEVQEGLEEPVKTRVKLHKNGVELVRSGAISTTMIFEEQKKHPTQYHTPYGKMNLAVDTRKINVKETDEEIEIRIEYALEAEEKPLAECFLRMKISQKE